MRLILNNKPLREAYFITSKGGLKMELPTILYKDGGIYQRKNGTYSYKSVKTEKEYNEHISNGWYPSLNEAISDKKAKDFEQQTNTVTHIKNKRQEKQDQQNLTIFAEEKQELIDIAESYGLKANHHMPIGKLKELISNYEAGSLKEDQNELDKKTTNSSSV